MAYQITPRFADVKVELPGGGDFEIVVRSNPAKKVLAAFNLGVKDEAALTELFKETVKELRGLTDEDGTPITDPLDDRLTEDLRAALMQSVTTAVTETAKKLRFSIA